MPKTLTIQLSDELERWLTLEAEKRNVSLEDLILQSLAQSIESSEQDDEPREVILESLHRSLQDVQVGRVRPVIELWEGISD
ncbi:MAG: hypothetical protein HC879_20350 [Leptolyngbyaceae cyanobacterium SL_5_9]|nr:hypothetical protein [Leptolyngbyaceae cyanobacterium SL_5_9]NJO75104.1 hypothetical protein [Leptolyngbyaceae cyanobacterium RM1_406_9]